MNDEELYELLVIILDYLEEHFEGPKREIIRCEEGGCMIWVK